nr:replicative DNA helicase [Clostridia bacterium]
MDTSGALIKQMPVSVDAEQAVLGAIIVNPESFDIIIGIITAEDFYIDHHKHIYSTLMR